MKKRLLLLCSAATLLLAACGSHTHHEIVQITVEKAPIGEGRGDFSITEQDTVPVCASERILVNGSYWFYPDCTCFCEESYFLQNMAVWVNKTGMPITVPIGDLKDKTAQRTAPLVLPYTAALIHESVIIACCSLEQ